MKENNIPGASPETEKVENKDDFHIISESENEDYVLPPSSYSMKSNLLTSRMNTR